MNLLESKHCIIIPKDSVLSELLVMCSNFKKLILNKINFKVKCLSLGRDTATEILGDQVQIITFRNIIKWAFEKNALIVKLTKIQIN